MIKEKTLFIYIIQCPVSKTIKIGRTSQPNPLKRINQIQQNNPFPLKIVSILFGDEWLEAQLHGKFSFYRIKGEWFSGDCVEELLEYIQQYRKYDPNTSELRKIENYTKIKKVVSDFSQDEGIITYVQGSCISTEKRDERFGFNGQESKTALKSYWRVMNDGRPDPAFRYFRKRKDIDLFHLAHPELGEYQVKSSKVGRPKSVETDRIEYQRQYWLKRKQKLKEKKQGQSNFLPGYGQN